MIDEDLRRLARRARETLSPADQAAWLRARVRAGELDASRLEVAAYLGNEAAVIATGKQAPTSPSCWATLRAWGKGLSSLGHEVALRAGLADVERSVRIVQSAADRVPPGRLKVHLDIHARVLSSRVDALAAWILLPSAPVREELAELTRDQAFSVSAVRTVELQRAGLPFVEVGSAPLQAVEVTWLLAASIIDGRPLVLGQWWSTHGAPGPVAEIASAIRRDLLPWALGLEDPLATRTETVLDRIEIASPCHESWENMATADDGRSRFCASCQHSVFDLSTMSRDEALAFLRERRGERACVRLYRREDGRVMTRDCLTGQRERARAFPRRVFMGLAR